MTVFTHNVKINVRYFGLKQSRGNVDLVCAGCGTKKNENCFHVDIHYVEWESEFAHSGPRIL